MDRRALHRLAAIGVAAAAALAGCALDDAPGTATLRRDALPNARLAPAWTGAPADAGRPGDRWIDALGEPGLRALVDEALAYNADVAIAGARVEQAAAAVRIAGASLLPSVGVFAKDGLKLGGDLTGLSGAGLTATWELDLWGRVRYAQRAASGQHAAAQADLEYARQSLAALVAKAWFLAVEATRQRRVAQDSVDASERLLALAQDRARIGNGTELDVALARASLNGLRDGARGIEAARLESIRALETLLGRYPTGVVEVAGEWRALPAEVSAGVPSELLERRPDVVAAQWRVAAAWDRTGEARAARLPRLSIAAGFSAISSDLFVLQNVDNPTVSIGASLLAPLFSGGALEGTQALRTAEQRQAVAQWARTALQAFAEVESSLSSQAALADRERLLEAALHDGERARSLQETRYRVGSADLRAVLQQDLALYSTRMALLRVQADRRVQRVRLHLAVGGDFGSPEVPPRASN
jgi:NodT family efflux transporter outer membrane factor (OMF) lipoprotein